MNGITILIAVVSTLLVGFLFVQGVCAILYSHSDEWKLPQRLRRFIQREAELPNRITCRGRYPKFKWTTRFHGIHRAV